MISPAFARYFQVVSGLPLMAFVFAGGIPGLIGFFIYTLPRSGWRVWRQPLLWGMGMVLVVRVVSNIAAARFTQAIYVQLFALMTPFLVVIFSQIVLKEKAPKYTWSALFLSMVGAVLMLSSEITEAGITFNVQGSDGLGIAFAITQATVSAIYFLLLRYAKQQGVPDHEIVTCQTVIVNTFALGASLALGEDWSPYLELSTLDWVLLIFFMLVTVFIANWLQVRAIAVIGPHIFSSALPWRLLSVMVLGWFLLGERIESIWQLLGTILVFITITGYFWLQSRLASQTAA